MVDTAGDSVLAVFDTAAGAVRAALLVQAEFQDRARTLPADQRLLFRIGIHLGDIVEKADGSVYGDAVNIAARLQALAEGVRWTSHH
ncbi:MAG: adenylate/guanylate cyclase domain-containing protein [Proteobacteria bacterium]|nr:adenylate/guanylate cyclase domain-containing protein [Pseudomonadota bacterium]